jgi:putative aldouronate transport system permease protein
MKKTLRWIVLILGLVLIITGFIGYCTPDISMPWLSGDPAGWSAWEHFVTFIAHNGGTLMLAGIVVILFRILVLPFLLDAAGTQKQWRVFGKNTPLTLFMLPGSLCLLLFNYLPMPGIVLAFKTFKKGRHGVVQSIADSAWNGLTGFSFLGTETVQNYIRNTLLYNFCWMILGLVVAVAIAIALSHLRNKKSTKFYQTFVFMPYFLSWVIASYLLYALISYDKGMLGGVMESLGVVKSRYDLANLYQAPQYWPLILTLANQWKYMGYNSIIYTAAISGIDTELYEAAMLDGAGVWQRIRYITVPLLKPMMIIMTIMAMGRMANADFGLFYNLPMGSGPLLKITGVYDTYVFNMITGSSTTNYGTIAATSLFQSVLGFILIFTSNMVVRKISPENSLF